MTIDAVTRIAAAQHRAFTVAQARSSGVSRAELQHRLATGEWELRHHGVVVVRGGPASWLTDLHAATLARTGAMASHRAGARLHGLDGVDVAPVEISVPRGAFARLDGVVVHRTLRLDEGDVAVVRGIRCTSVARTLCDLGAVVDSTRLEQALDSALRSGLRREVLDECLARLHRPGPSGTSALVRVLALPHRAAEVPATALERLLRTIAQAPLLPPSKPEYRLRRPDGRVVARFDVAFPAVQLGVEAHSDAWHYGPRRGERDRRRDRAVAELRWDVVYLGWAEVTDPAQAVASLRAVCRARAELLGVDPLTWQPVPR